MTGKSHIAFNTASAIVVSSLFHVGGTTCSWQYLLSLLSGHSSGAALLSFSTVQKCIYYIFVIFGALLPDIDQPNSTIGRRCGGVSEVINRYFGHRTITHSLCGLSLVFILYIGVGSILLSLLASQGIILSHSVKELLFLALLSLLLGCGLHILADSFTKQGVPLLWPGTRRYGLFPSASLRFKVGTWAEYAVLWSIIFLVGIGLGYGSFGL